MALETGTRLPDAKLLRMGEGGPEAVNLSDLLKGRKVVLFALPGAYTGTCSTAHVPGFIHAMDALREKGVDAVYCLSVNDPFVLKAWGEMTGGTAAGIEFLGDAEGAFTRAVGMNFDAPPVGLFGRSKRYSLLADDGVVKMVQVEQSPGVCEVSSGAAMIEALDTLTD